jgi:hypothetical protein
MTNEQILDQQVEALEKLLELKSEVIQEMRNKIDRLNMELAAEKMKQQYHQPLGGWYPGPVVGPGLYDPSPGTTKPFLPQLTPNDLLLDPNGNLIISTNTTPSVDSVPHATTGYIAPVISLAK